MNEDDAVAPRTEVPQTCGARLRDGGRCAACPARGRKRCRIHGGAPGSGAPKGNRNALKHGGHTAATCARMKAMRDYMRASQAFTMAAGAGASRRVLRRYYAACERVAAELTATTQRLLAE
jgi:hypothetical protein